MKLLIIAFCIIAASCDIVLLKADQINLIKESFNQIKDNKVDILYAVFKDNQEIKDKFPQFAGKDLESIKESREFKNHAAKIIGFASDIVALGDNESAEESVATTKFLINDLAVTHKKRGITKTQFNAFRASIFLYFQNNVSWSDNVSEAWTRAFDAAYFILFSALDGHPL
ncbi:unnamed protein product [Chironomus riparius]|uniref:Globin domain-containing protein n=1 Tax=Chironomus riparius TaxID=315576 RepID=A0A9N9RQG5_9DIPT|nr:unnamed protein product [Chironomus riparius]